MEEIWKNITGMEERYQVSSLGRVRNKETKNILSEQINKDKHCEIRLGSERKHFDIHRLVAQEFIQFVPQKDIHYDVHHVDEVAWHNFADNLVYMDHDKHMDLHSSVESKSFKRKVSVINITTGILYNSLYEASKSVEKTADRKRLSNVSKNIKAACKRRGHAHGYAWRFKKEE